MICLSWHVKAKSYFSWIVKLDQKPALFSVKLDIWDFSAWRPPSIHLKHQKAQKLSLDEAISKLETLDNFLKETFENVMSTFEKACKPSGIMGTVSSQTLSSVRMILEGLRALEQLLKEPSPNYKIDVYTCLTVQVQNLHAMGHFRGQFPSLLQYAQNLANTVYESIKRVVRWAAYYCTHEKCYYPVVSQATPLDALPRMTNLKQRESSMIENERWESSEKA